MPSSETIANYLLLIAKTNANYRLKIVSNSSIAKCLKYLQATSPPNDI